MAPAGLLPANENSSSALPIKSLALGVITSLLEIQPNDFIAWTMKLSLHLCLKNTELAHRSGSREKGKGNNRAKCN
jgi:hypothetical protein